MGPLPRTHITIPGAQTPAHGNLGGDAVQHIGNVERQFGTREMLKGLLLQLVGSVCALYAEPLKRLAEENAAEVSRRDALSRMSEYLRKNIAVPDLNVIKVVAATYLSPIAMEQKAA